MKALLVMDMPENCDICPFCNNCDYTKPDWCPLRPMPEKKDWKPSSGITLAMFGTGWNACIDEIIGGEE